MDDPVGQLPVTRTWNGAPCCASAGTALEKRIADEAPNAAATRLGNTAHFGLAFMTPSSPFTAGRHLEYPASSTSPWLRWRRQYPLRGESVKLGGRVFSAGLDLAPLVVYRHADQSRG